MTRYPIRWLVRHARSRLLIATAALVFTVTVGIVVLRLLNPLTSVSFEVFVSCALSNQDQRVNCYEERIPALYPTYSVEEIYAVVGMLQSYDPALYYCHVVAHEIAEAVVAEDPSRWHEFLWEGPDNDHCSYGFFHGLALSAFRGEPLSLEQLEAQRPLFETACETPLRIYHPARELGRRVACNHGLGHMMYYVTDRNVPEALALCDLVVRENDRLPFVHGRAQCYEGVLMQHFFRQEPEDYRELDRRAWSLAEGKEFCAMLEGERHKSACQRSLRYLMLPDLEEGRGSKEICEAQPNTEEQRFCYGRIMSAILINTTDSPDRIVRACSGMPATYRGICIGHAAVSIVGNRGGTAGMPDARHLCRIVEHEEDAEWCFKALAQHASFYFPQGTPDRRRYCAHLPLAYRQLCENFAYAPL